MPIVCFKNPMGRHPVHHMMAGGVDITKEANAHFLGHRHGVPFCRLATYMIEATGHPVPNPNFTQPPNPHARGFFRAYSCRNFPAISENRT
jgi:hypothetical protein